MLLLRWGGDVNVPLATFPRPCARCWCYAQIGWGGVGGCCISEVGWDGAMITLIRPCARCWCCAQDDPIIMAQGWVGWVLLAAIARILLELLVLTRLLELHILQRLVRILFELLVRPKVLEQCILNQLPLIILFEDDDDHTNELLMMMIMVMLVLMMMMMMIPSNSSRSGVLVAVDRTITISNILSSWYLWVSTTITMKAPFCWANLTSELWTLVPHFGVKTPMPSRAG